MHFSRLLAYVSAVSTLTLAAPLASGAPTVSISAPQATIIGLADDNGVEQFPGIPFAQPPVGSLRLKPPQKITASLGTYSATANGPACPQFLLSTDAVNNGAIPTSALGLLLDTPLFQTALDESEDCLYINVHRPTGTTSSSKLPVIFWIFGGGFELGWNSMYDGSEWVRQSISRNQPIIFVTVNYRVGGFGFLPGKEILADGSANLGLLDQRLGLEWTADNIAAFGGDPDKVTIWGESAGAISVFDQMALYDGDISYNGKDLFRGAIMNSGSIIPADPVDCPKGQVVYDKVVSVAGCSSASDTLECLRGVDYATLLNATNSVRGILSYASLALSYLPRPDGTALTESPEILAQSGRYAKVPFIVGDQEDEGTLFALFQSNITTIDQLVTYFSEYYFNNANTSTLEALIATYPDTTTYGSPFRTGILYNWYPQFKRIAAILGDLTFTLTRRAFLNVAKSVNPTVSTWSYLSSYDYGTPVLGTFHASDLLQVFFGVVPNYASTAFASYYINFANNLDPNNGTNVANWPEWGSSNTLLNMYPLFSTEISDDFRPEPYNFIVANIESLHI